MIIWRYIKTLLQICNKRQIEMQWNGISEFIQVAEKHSFTQASQLLGVSTAQVSRQVTALENRLKTKLFYRTTRKVSLTEEGQIFYQHCRNLLDGLQVAEQTISNLQSAPQGHIKLSAPVTYGEKKIIPLVNDFLVSHPQITINALLSNRQVDLIEEGVDLAIRLGKLSDSNMIARKLGDRRNYVCASNSYINKFGSPYTLSELADHNCLLGTLDYWRFTDKGKEKNIRVSGNFRCNSGIALLDAAYKGQGIVQLPDYYVRDSIEKGDLVVMLENYRADDEGIWAVYPHNRHVSPKIKFLIKFLKDNLV